MNRPMVGSILKGPLLSTNILSELAVLKSINSVILLYLPHFLSVVQICEFISDNFSFVCCYTC